MQLTQGECSAIPHPACLGVSPVPSVSHLSFLGFLMASDGVCPPLAPSPCTE